VITPSGDQIEIAFADQRATAVEVGGGLRTYSAAGRELIDGYGIDEMSSSGRGQLLIPWPNRIQDGSYEFEGRRHQLPIDDVEEQDAIHGLVRWDDWTVGEREPHRVVMEHEINPQPGYPFPLAVSVEYALSHDGLRVTTTATNLGPDPCPYGCGAHPYLKLGTGTIDPLVLSVPARTFMWSDDRGIPIGSGPVEGTEFDFRRPRPIGTTRLDTAFTDLERDEAGLARVSLEDPEGRDRLTLWVDDAYGYLMIFTGDEPADVQRRALAVEPMTCPPNAFRSGTDLVRLEPGQSFTGRWGIRPG
jgi:aldose 1-epimerase